MTNWRLVLNPLQRPHAPTHNPQNTQNRKAEVDSEYFEQFEHSSKTSQEGGSPDIPLQEPDLHDPVLSVQASSRHIGEGDRITWLSMEGKPRGPVLIDFVHTDPDGSTWCFVTLSDGWAAVNANTITSIQSAKTT